MLSISRCRKDLFRKTKDEIIPEVIKSKHLQTYQKEYWRHSDYESVFRQDHLTYLFDNEGLSYNKGLSYNCLQEQIGNFSVKRVMVKPRHSAIYLRGDSLRNSGFKWSHAKEKGISTKNDLKLTVKLAQKACRKRAMCNYEI